MKVVTVGLGAGAMLFAVLSARLGVPYLAFGVAGCAVVAAVLCAWGKLDERATPYLVFLLGLAFLYQTTLISNGLVGSDIHTEYYFYRAALDGWDTGIAHAYNTAIGTTVIAPFLTNVFRIPGYWIYKAIFPLLFAFVPVMLFIIYRKEFGDKVAFLGTLFFVTLPTYTLEMIGLPRQMLGELMLAVVLLLVIVRPIRLKYSVPLTTLAATCAYLFHYITGPALLLYLAGGTAILILYKRRVFPVRWLFVAIVVSSLVGFAYYTNVADGVVASNLGGTSRATVENIADDVENVVDDEDVLPPGIDTPIDLPPTEESSSWFARYFGRQEPLVRTALGLDFADASPLGKVFRVLQFGTQLCLILGCVWLFRNRKRVSAEYIAFTITALTLIAACVVLPRFSNIINVTRFYHLALFLVAPLLIVGGLYVFRNLRVLVFVLFIPYILFTTGAVFEASRETDITKVNIPYSIALSNERIGIVGTYTSNDLAVRDQAMRCGYKLLLTDINGMLLLSEVADPFTYLYVPGHNLTGDMPEVAWGYISQHVGDLPPGTFIYLTEWNTQNQLLMFKPSWYAMTDTASGMRQTYSFGFVGLPGDFVEVYRQGDAVLLQKGDNL